MSITPPQALARQIAAHYATVADVVAVALGGSQVGSLRDPHSDVDIYVYSRELLPLAERRRVATAAGGYAEIGNTFWESGDEWHDPATHIKVDVTFRECAWIEAALRRILVDQTPSLGYSTTLWHNVLTAIPLFDRSGWFAALQRSTRCPYPNQLRQRIINKNFAVLKLSGSSYLDQLRLAAQRQDPVAVNHRLAALLSSYFDVLFAVNHLPHPGEKRLLRLLATRNFKTPVNARYDIERLLQAAALSDASVNTAAETLLARLESFLKREGLIGSQEEQSLPQEGE